MRMDVVKKQSMPEFMSKKKRDEHKAHYEKELSDCKNFAKPRPKLLDIGDSLQSYWLARICAVAAGVRFNIRDLPAHEQMPADDERLSLWRKRIFTIHLPYTADGGATIKLGDGTASSGTPASPRLSLRVLHNAIAKDKKSEINNGFGCQRLDLAPLPDLARMIEIDTLAAIKRYGRKFLFVHTVLRNEWLSLTVFLLFWAL